MKIQCPECTKSLQIKDEHAGKRVRCPACGEAITIPDAPADHTELSVVSGACESCGQSMTAGALICMNCGHNRKTGRKVHAAQSVSLGGPPPDSGEEDLAEGLVRSESHAISSGLGYPGLVALLGWGGYGAQLIAETSTAADVNKYFWIAIVVTGLAAVWGGFRYSKAIRLVRHGVDVDAIMTSVTGGFPGSTLIRVQCEFELNGTKHQKMLNIEDSEISIYENGWPIRLVVDPKDPMRVMFRRDVYK